MKTHIYSVAGIAALMGLLPGAAAHAASGNVSTATGVAAGEVIKPIVLTHTTGAALSFGTFSPGTGGKVIVTTGGAGSVTKGVTFVPGISVTSADQFTLTGRAKQHFTIKTTGGAVTNGINSMPFTTSPSSTSGSTSTTGTFRFTVGGKLTVAGGEAGGHYTGSYTATVAYN
ncbi:DUF4402 domain-containing protein [Telmatospirillum sp.]|uniref:DUF4402 domain-containing protein n=1 Tax=Telmatospirillum sp. TaxID=2079197 RepID=UPI0028405798|nr:DUF4402 domain-containing protein [Telmatospirillum sp.]MDR3437869.1 DUF4402 domain-containing protein [Telmatospirillum sp.]